MQTIIDRLKKIDTYRYIITVALILVTIVYSIKFSNAGSNYDQAVAFRPMCICLGLLVLVNMDFKKWINIPSLIILIVSFLVVRYGYLYYIIPDVCKYEHVDVIRMGKAVGVIWSVVYLSIIIDFFKSKLWLKIKELYLLPCIAFALYFILILIFGHKYAEQIFLIFESIALFYLFLQDNTKQRIMTALKDAIILSFIFVMYKCLRHRPYDTERYQMYFGNSNMAGTYMAGVIIAIFVRIKDIESYITKKGLRIFLFFALYILIGIACSVALFNYTRTTIIGLMFAFFISFILDIIKAKKYKEKIFKAISKYLLVVASTVALFYLTFLALRYIPAYSNDPVLFINEYNDEGKIVKGDSIDSKKYTSMGSYLRIVFGKWGILIDFEAMENGEEAEETVIDGRDVTNGRTEVWERFVPEFNLTGHYPRYVYDLEGGIIPHAHNSYFQIIYEDGLITGIVYIGLMCIFMVMAMLMQVGIVNKDMPEKNDYENINIYSNGILSVLFIACVMVSQCLEWISRPQYVLYVMTIFVFINLSTVKKIRKEK